jgi:two-component system, OmpR family, sensor kinase
MDLLARSLETGGCRGEIGELEIARKGLQRLGGLVTDLLDVARLDTGVLTIVPEAMELVPLLKEMAELYSTQNNSVELAVQDDLLVQADRGRLRQCLENLLSNAVQHSPKGAAVTLSVSAVEGRDGPRMKIEIIDRGPGIPADLLPRIFERYVTSQTHRGGLGIGLYLAKRIAQLHGGELRVESSPAKGSRFILELPALREP